MFAKVTLWNYPRLSEPEEAMLELTTSQGDPTQYDLWCCIFSDQLSEIFSIILYITLFQFYVFWSITIVTCHHKLFSLLIMFTITTFHHNPHHQSSNKAGVGGRWWWGDLWLHQHHHGGHPHRRRSISGIYWGTL